MSGQKTAIKLESAPNPKPAEQKMSPGRRESPQLRRLRGLAETMIEETTPRPPLPELLPETQRLMHELQVHQVELEMQNEELSRAMEEIEAGLHKYSELFDLAPIGYLTVQGDSTILDANLKCAQLLGLKRLYLRKALFVHFLPAENRAGFQDFIERVLNTRSRQVIETTLIGKNGLTFTSQIHAVAVEGCGEGVTCLLALVDLTELKRTQDDLERARDAAQASSRAKSTFLANMSHEIRTPISGVVGLLEILRRSKLDPEQTRYVELATGSVNHLLKIIDDILDFSKIEADRLQIESVDFDPRKVLEESSLGFADAASHKGIDFSRHVAAAVPSLLSGDPHRFRQILVNLIANAVKFTSGGGVSVVVSTPEVEGERCILEVSVSDTGIGIQPERIAGLFQSFSQGDDSTARVYGGSGLGLTISRQLAEKMGGSITVESEPDRGSVFRLILPFRISKPNNKISEAEMKATGAKSQPQGRPLHILLAEDNPINCEVAATFLRMMDWEVTTVGNGRAAVDALEAGCYDLVLMDVQMPGMDGLEATRIIREKEAGGGPRTPIIGLTAHAMNDERHKGITSGMDEYLAKPFEPEVLYATIQRWVPETVGQSGPSRTAETATLVAMLSTLERRSRDELVKTLPESLSEGLEAIREAHRAGDREKLKFLAHRMRGTLVVFGFKATAAVTGEIEKHAGANRLEEIPAALARLEREIESINGHIAKNCN